MRRAVNALVILITLAYPVTIYFGSDYLKPQHLALVLVVTGLSRMLTSQKKWLTIAASGALLLAALSMVSHSLLPLKIYPVLVNFTLMSLFLMSLRYPPSMAERFARLQDHNLSPQGVIYTRKVTWLWVIFFALNGGIAFGTAMWASQATWALYTGVISYLLTGLVYGLEWLVRRFVKARTLDGCNV